MRALRTFGRLIVMTATPASRSISRLSKAMSGSNYIPGVEGERRQRRTDSVRDNVHGLDASHGNERLMELIADSVRRGHHDRRNHGAQRQTTMPAAGQCANQQRAEPGIEDRVQILVATADDAGVCEIDDRPKMSAM